MADLDNTVSTKVADSTLKQINDYADDHGMSKSEAVRNRLRAGFDAADDDTNTLRQRLTLAAVVLFYTAFPTAAAATGYLSVAISFVIIVTAVVIFAPELDELLNRIPDLLP